MPDLSALDLIIALVGGMVAGGMNALAGYGSVITLTILMEIMGLPPTIANATNRIGIVAVGLSSTAGYYKHGKVDLRHSLPILLPTVLGAMLGIGLALVVDNGQFRIIFRYMVLVLFFLILINPKRWLREHSEVKKMPLWLSFPVFFAVGLYGGFIQMGMGLVFLAGAVMLGGYNLIEANGVKMVVVTIYTLIGVGIFMWHGMLAWLPGLLLAVGQAVGGYATASLAGKYPQANRWAYWLLLAIVFFIVAKTFILG